MFAILCRLRYNQNMTKSIDENAGLVDVQAPDLVTCNDCARVSFAVPRAYAEDEVRRFNEYYNTLDEKTKSHFGGESSLTNYATCLCGCSEFHPATEVERKRANGHTINPVVLGLVPNNSVALD